MSALRFLPWGISLSFSDAQFSHLQKDLRAHPSQNAKIPHCSLDMLITSNDSSIN